MEMIQRVGRKFCDDRILALRSLVMQHRTPMTLGMEIAAGAGLLGNLLACALVMGDFTHAGDHETATLFFLCETAILLGFFVVVAGPSLAPILDRARIAGVDSLHQQRFILLEFVTSPVTLVIGTSVTVAFMIVLWPQYLSMAVVLLLMLSWLAMSTATACLLVVVARRLNVTPAALAIGCLLLLLLASLGPLALAGTPILEYVPVSGWTTKGALALHAGDPLTALLWSLLQFLAAAVVIIGLRWKEETHAARA